MKIGGIGEQALCIQLHELYKIGELPKDVELVCILPDLGGRHEPMAAWVPHPRGDSLRAMYLHIRHPYCFRGAEQGQPLMAEDLESFLKRYHELLRQEQLWKNEKVSDRFGDEYMGGWVDNDA